MSTMRYREYSALVEYDEADRILVGHIAGIRDIVGFHADSVTGLETAFREAVDNYLDACERLGQSPEAPAGTEVSLHLPRETYRAARQAAERSGQSFDQWAARVLGEAAELRG